MNSDMLSAPHVVLPGRTTEISLIVEEDLAWLYDLTKEFNDRWYRIPLDPGKTMDALRLIILGNSGVGFRTAGGAIIGTIEDDPFRDYKVLQERGWYSRDGSGLHLLRHFTQYGRDISVDEVRISTLNENNRVTRIIGRYGYKPIETSHGIRFKEA